MDARKLLLGVAALALIAGLLLASFAPGGWFNREESGAAALRTPFGTVQVETTETKSSVWPTVGYVLLGLGGVVIVVAYAMRRPPRLK
jgi:hypothetical protein